MIVHQGYIAIAIDYVVGGCKSICSSVLMRMMAPSWWTYVRDGCQKLDIRLWNCSVCCCCGWCSRLLLLNLFLLILLLLVLLLPQVVVLLLDADDHALLWSWYHWGAQRWLLSSAFDSICHQCLSGLIIIGTIMTIFHHCHITTTITNIIIH